MNCEESTTFDYPKHFSKPCIAEAMEMAACNGHIDIVELCIEKGVTNFNEAMVRAAYHDNYTVVKLLIKHGANNLNEVIIIASRLCHNKVVKLCIEAMARAARNLHFKIAKLYKKNEKRIRLKYFFLQI
jgi:hypothetical protein